MIRSPSHFTSLSRTLSMMFGGGKAYLKPFSHLSFKAFPPDAPLPVRFWLKYLGTLSV